jgi:hypothetical protein
MSFDPPIVINCRDRLTPLCAMIDWLTAAGHENITLLDNQSTYRPLLDYYRCTPHKVVRLEHNLGARALWLASLDVLNGWYVYSDPDIVPIEQCPTSLLSVLRALLDEFPAVSKAGPGLYLDDVPATMDSLEWERALISEQRRLYSKATDAEAYISKIDTTFALHRPHARFTYTAIRTGYPYQARHTSWYTDGQPLTDEDTFYLSRATKGPLGTSWGRRV